MSSKLLPIKSKKIITLLNALGFVKRRQTGGHLILRHSRTNKIVPIPMHVGEIKNGTLISI